MIEAFLSAGSEFFTALGRVPGKGQVPVGIVKVERHQMALWPHAVWFPWSSGRNRVEFSVGFIQELKKEGMVLIIAEEDTVQFFAHLGRYGLLRRAGTLRWYFNGEPGVLFQGVV